MLHVVDDEARLRFGNDLPDGRLGERYDHELSFVGGQDATAAQVAVADGALPAGLQLTGRRVVGTPAQVGPVSFALRVDDATGAFAVERFLVEIFDADGLRIITTGLAAGRVGAPYADRIRAVTTEGAAIDLAVSQGDLPTGIEMSTDGEITGTPTQPGVFAFTVRGTDRFGQVDRRAFGISVDPGTTEAASSSGGCRCAGRGSHRWSWLVSVLGLLLFLGRRSANSSRRRIAGAVLAVSFAGAPTTAEAQSVLTQWRSETYRPRTGGTLIRLSAPDDGSATIALPFAFDFFGTAYRDIVVSANGYVTFGPVGDARSNQSFPDAAAPNDVIALVWDDLEGDLVSWHVEGNPPNRVAILQFSDSIRRRQPAGGRPQVQLWLYESGVGRFELRFGGLAQLTDPSVWSASVGFENATGTVGTNALSCAALCRGNDLAALANRVFSVERDVGPDLLAVRVASPDRVDPGLETPIVGELRSAHGRALGPFRWSVRLLTEAGAPVGTWRATFGPLSLGPFERRTVSATVAIPRDTPPGRYRFGLDVDVDGAVAEVDESNNSVRAAAPAEAVTPAPDFLVSVVRFAPTEVRAGERLQVEGTIANRGNADGLAAYRLVVSTNPAISAADVRVLNAAVPLSASTSSTFAHAVTVPDLAPGPWFVGALADPEAATDELDETNNNRAAEAPLMVFSEAVSIRTTTLLTATAGRPYQFYLTAFGGSGRFTWRLIDGALPPGLVLEPTGRIIGRPEQAAEAPFTVEASSRAAVATADLVLPVVDRAAPLVIANRQLLPGVVGASYPPSSEMPDGLVTVGGVPPVRFSLEGLAPAGLALDETGRLTGTPLEPGVFDLRLMAVDSVGSEARRILPLTIAEPGRLTLVAEALPPARVETPYVYPLRVVGRTSGTDLSFRAEALPPGIRVTAEGRLRGTPVSIGRSVITVRVSQSDGDEDSTRFVLNVEDGDGFALVPGEVPAATVGEFYRAFVEARGGTAPRSWQITADSLPKGLSWQVVSGEEGRSLLISGVAESSGLTPILVDVTDAAGRRASRAYAIVARAHSNGDGEASGCRCAQPARSGGFAFVLLIAGVLWARLRSGAETGPNDGPFGVC